MFTHDSTHTTTHGVTMPLETVAALYSSESVSRDGDPGQALGPAWSEPTGSALVFGAN